METDKPILQCKYNCLIGMPLTEYFKKEMKILLFSFQAVFFKYAYSGIFHNVEMPSNNINTFVQLRLYSKLFHWSYSHRTMDRYYIEVSAHHWSLFLLEAPDAWIQYRDTHLISFSAVVVYLRHKRLHLPELSWRSILVIILCVYLSVQTQRFGVFTHSLKTACG